MSRVSHKSCEHCGRVFSKDPRNTWKYWERAKYCSQACSGEAWAATAKLRQPSIREKFQSYVVKADGCWRWSGPRDKDGYGVFFVAKKQYRAPVVALEVDGRPVPKGMYALHHCDNPECVRPDHLYPGTPKQNVADMIDRGRANFHFGRRAS